MTCSVFRHICHCHRRVDADVSEGPVGAHYMPNFCLLLRSRERLGNHILFLDESPQHLSVKYIRHSYLPMPLQLVPPPARKPPILVEVKVQSLNICGFVRSGSILRRHAINRIGNSFEGYISGTYCRVDEI